MPFDFEAIREFVRCPQSRAELVREAEFLVSTDPETRLRYAVCDDIPILLVDQADSLPPEEWADVMRRHGRDSRTGRLATE